uniref:Solute-binding protein family 5 domain-containing protein n=1 Tax=Odontella aurita TaxID=265563 RepID=A0A7S4JSI8_9STRA|mmetsp:Transcript_5314/g.15458  ORF Transcript_5314/g.15458 Transcript_5314/m.15458 type:complete len:539 (+) Transcript_5314:93-1709(+)
MVGLKHLVKFVSLGLVSAALSHTDPVLVGQTFLAGSTDPTEGSTPWALTSHGVSEKLFTVNKHGDIVPQIAVGVVKISDLVWEVTLKRGYKFSNGIPVDPQTVADSLMELNAKNDSAQSSLGSITATPQGDMKVRIESERPTHVMDAVLAEWVFVIFTKDSLGNFVFTGPYIIENYASDHIDLAPNRYYDDQSLKRPMIEIKKFSDGHDLAKGVENNEIDIAFHLPIDTLPALREADGVKVKSFEVGYHYMAFHNTDRLKDVRVRKAIDLAIDRMVLSQALAGGKGTRSLFPDYSPYFVDESDPHGDPSAAEALLEEAGWSLNSSNGKREKQGEELTINLVAYPHRPGLVIMQPLIEEAINDLGINVNSILTGMDWSETQKIIDERSFDLLLWAQHTLPAGDPLWFLSTFFRSDGGSNHANLQSDTVDSMLDELSLAEDHDERVALTAATQKSILEKVPVSNLVTPYWHVGLSERMADYEPWGSDYYVIRSDLFLSNPSNEGVSMQAESSSVRLMFAHMHTMLAHLIISGLIGVAAAF